MKLKVITTTILFVILSFGLSVAADNNKPIPYGRVPLLNGKIDKKEWDTDKVCTIDSQNVTISLKQDSFFVYLGITNNSIKNSGVDIYLNNMSRDTVMFHISAAHGQRFFKNNTWSETTWGASGLWTSNLVEMIVGEDGNSFIYPEIFECQISKKFLSKDKFKLMLRMKRPDNWVPPNADTLSSAGWFQFRLH